MPDNRDFAAHYVIMTLLIAAVIGLMVMNIAQAADKGLWDSACYGSLAFVAMAPLTGWVFEKVGLLRN
jgi:hypothetical protein